MSYPTLTARQATNLVHALISSSDPDWVDVPIAEDGFVLECDGDRYDRTSVEAAAQHLREEWDTIVNSIPQFSADDLYILEVLFSAKIHAALDSLSIDHLEDKGFWRYLALFPFRWYLYAREGKSLQPQNFGGLLDSNSRQLGDEDSETESLFVNQALYRAYVIGQAIRDETDPVGLYSRVNSIPRGGPVTDFWHSHVLRVRIGRIGRVAHALVDATSGVPESEMKEFARRMAKLVTRLKSNVLLDGYHKSDVDGLIAEFS